MQIKNREDLITDFKSHVIKLLSVILNNHWLTITALIRVLVRHNTNLN